MLRALVLVMFVSCGGGESGSGSNAPVTSSPASPDDETVEKAIRSIGSLSDLAAKHGKDCEGLARDLGAYAKREAPTIAAFKKIMSDPAKQKAIADKFGERVQQVAQASLAALRERCSAHPAVQQLFKALQ